MNFQPPFTPPYPQNEHEAKVVALMFFTCWGIGLLLLYWEMVRSRSKEEQDRSATLDGTNKENSQLTE
jgi:hypothetical protein